MENNNRSGNNFFSGFILGALVGAAVVFLLGTKTGKKILKAISEEGSENIANLLNKINKSVDLQDEVFEDDPIFADASVDKSAGKGNKTEKRVVIEEKPRVTRRFFRGISRHVN